MNYKKILSNKVYWGVGAVVAVIALYAFFGRSSGPGAETAKAGKRTITQMVSATGNVKPDKSVDLAFETSGRIASVNAAVGDTVGAGQIIASISSSELVTQMNKAQADLASQNASLDKANVDLGNYYGTAVNTINGAYTGASDAIRIKIDALFSDDETNNPKLTFDSTNSQGKTTSETQRLVIRNTLNSWLSQINGLNSSSSQQSVDSALSDAKTNINTIYGFLSTLMDTTINALALSPSTLASYKTSISDARSEIDTAAASITALIQNISSQKALIVSKTADIKSYQASVDNINAQMYKTSLRSPIYGVVTKQDAKVGEIASPGVVVVSVISVGDYEVDSYIPEVDIARVKTGDKANITLDAYGNDAVFAATVTSIDPGETVIEGVSTYLTKFRFAKPDARIKPGMTANIDIISASHEDALSLPQRAVQKKTDGDFVTVYKLLQNNVSSTEERKVTTGLRGFDGYVEILNGVSEGEQVIIPTLGK